MKTNMLTRHYHSFPFHKPLGDGGFCCSGNEEGDEDGMGLQEGPLVAHGAPCSHRQGHLHSIKSVWGESLCCLGGRFSLGQILFSFLSPFSTCSLIHLSQLQSSPAMKESDPKFYFSPSHALRLSEINATMEDNELSLGRLVSSTGSTGSSLSS